MQFLLFGMGMVATIGLFVFLPETAHHRGMDDILLKRRQRREEEESRREKEGLETRKTSWWERKSENWVFVWLNPLTPLKMLVHPHVLAMVRPPSH